MKTKMGNVEKLRGHIAAAASHGAHIIVFSEGSLGIASYNHDGGGVASGGLAEAIPDNVGGVPCTERGLTSAPALQALSCAAREHNITVVYDTGDLVQCSPHNPFNSSLECGTCPTEGFFRFNTQVALSSDGALLA